MALATLFSRVGDRRLALTILLAGGAAAIIDFLYLTIETALSGGDILRPWKGVAAALIGVQAVATAGPSIALVGVALHFLIAIGAAAFYCPIAARAPLMLRFPWFAGVVFGALFLLAMNYIILPLSVIGRPLYVGSKGLFDALVSHVLMIGLPISLLAAARLRKSI
ncbi:hypothetical protein [Caulobacter sp. UNC358MFTsu5.1]|uniref:hypothetical protein n=1 Tax=Caulobacter sp. UNC358MFTsu5.1 TaxID=1449049 RepID=UPI0012DD0DA9|nr:hypothetical protein [Caulobacter sp. UNC358MFTsu5.1]